MQLTIDKPRESWAAKFMPLKKIQITPNEYVWEDDGRVPIYKKIHNFVDWGTYKSNGQVQQIDNFENIANDLGLNKDKQTTICSLIHLFAKGERFISF